MPAIPDFHRILGTHHLHQGNSSSSLASGDGEKLGISHQCTPDAGLPSKNKLQHINHATSLDDGDAEDKPLYDVPTSSPNTLNHDVAMEDFPEILSLEAVLPQDVKRLKILQTSDPTVKVVKKWVHEGRIPPKLELRTYDTLIRNYSSIFPQLQLDPRGILIRSCQNLLGEEEPKVCVPDEMIPEVLLHAHAQPGRRTYGCCHHSCPRPSRFPLSPATTVDRGLYSGL